MKNPFRRNPQPASSKRSLTIAQRIERVKRITTVMAERAIQNDPSLGKFAGSPEVRAMFEDLSTKSDEQLLPLLELLEASMPEEFKNQR